MNLRVYYRAVDPSLTEETDILYSMGRLSAVNNGQCDVLSSLSPQSFYITSKWMVCLAFLNNKQFFISGGLFCKRSRLHFEMSKEYATLGIQRESLLNNPLLQKVVKKYVVFISRKSLPYQRATTGNSEKKRCQRGRNAAILCRQKTTFIRQK